MGVTRTLTDSYQEVLSAGGAFGIDQRTIAAQLQPLLQQTLLTALNQIPGLSVLVPHSQTRDRGSAKRNTTLGKS